MKREASLPMGGIDASRDPEYIFVVIDEVDTDNWGRKGLVRPDADTSL